MLSTSIGGGTKMALTVVAVGTREGNEFRGGGSEGASTSDLNLSALRVELLERNVSNSHRHGRTRLYIQRASSGERSSRTG